MGSISKISISNRGKENTIHMPSRKQIIFLIIKFFIFSPKETHLYLSDGVSKQKITLVKYKKHINIE